MVMVDFEWFVKIPVADEKRERIFEKERESLMLPSRKIMTSSSNTRWVRKQSSDILRPQRSLSLLADAINRLRPSMTIKNRRGERGQPCLRPLSEWKKMRCRPIDKYTKSGSGDTCHDPCDEIVGEAQMDKEHLDV